MPHFFSANKIAVETKRIEFGKQVIDVVESAPNGLRGTYAEKSIAMIFAGWVSPSFRDHINTIGYEVMTGNVAAIIPQVVLNYDAIHDTTSSVVLQTVDNNLPGSNERQIRETTQDKRIRSIERTKFTGSVMQARNMNGKSYAIKNNLVNKAVWRFQGTTSAFKKEKGISPRQSPRDFAQPPQLDGVNFVESIFAGLIANAEEGSSDTALIGEMERLSESIGAIVERGGVHRLPLRTIPIAIEGRKAPETPRIEPPHQPHAIAL